MSDKSIKAKFDELLAFEDDTEKIEFDATMLAMRFLGLADAEMARQKISKKELAKQVETSASFITQMFRGDRKPSWTMLAKMQKALDLKFKISTEAEWEESLSTEIMDYHKRWAKSVNYRSPSKEDQNAESILALVDENDYALAG
ncbi:helix-turn-helix domain-containing protein [Owenweeksia hongkongensis]|uniref:helix-turn-helix domain-containing protein n=1 Tax=Owenweeksia hongkongensis TaxID=253245 RepID=UPI003A926B15